jgi:proton-translocating NADH-quinone oxidoreductase chain L
MYSLIVFFPLIGFISGSLFGLFFGFGVCIITTTLIFCTFLISLKLFFSVVINNGTYKLYFFNWFSNDILNIDWVLNLDSLTSIMLIVVTFISFLVHLYSIEYMGHDPHQPRFMSYLSLFTFFMLILVTANNLLQMFIGWEGVGLASYLLINFWFTRIQANKAAIKAMLINRIGDFFLLLGIFSIYLLFESIDYDILLSQVTFITNYKLIVGPSKFFLIDFICFCLFFGAMGKSAQFGLHTWLPDAMEGPTPVSALIHAATMVTAGIFLIARTSFLFEFSPIVLNFITVIGALTAFFAATTGIFQNDIKKVIAYSTCSQLGYMTFACGLSGYDVGIFHLSNHAFFKALLFLAAGSIIHAVADEQDMRNMGGLKKILPLSYSAILVGSLALTGFPFLTGFFSKDFILEISYSKYSITGHFAYYLGVLAAFCTSFYSTRLLYLVFLSNSNGNKHVILNASESSFFIKIPLILLSFLSIIIGYISYDIFVGFGTDFWGSSIFILPQNYSSTDIEFLPIFFKILPFFISLFGIFFSFYLYNINFKLYFLIKKNPLFLYMYTFFNKKWFIDRIYNQLFGQNFLKFAYQYTYQNVDRGFLEIFGPIGILLLIKNFFFSIKFFQNGLTYSYLSLILIFLIVIVFICLNINIINIFLIILPFILLDYVN